MKVEIQCTACGVEALLLREAVYAGLTKTGEKLCCSACGHIFASEEEVPFKERKVLQVFTEDDRSRDPELFKDDKPVFCHHCRHYIVNPFTQWCSLHKREVEATGTCVRFEEQAPPAPIL